MTLDIIPLPNLSAVEAVAMSLAPVLRRGDTLLLQGPLGAGKTNFARLLLRVLGITEDVPSPTFTLLQTYDAAHFTIYHFDLYRLDDEKDLLELGWDDALADGLCIIEWPERAAKCLPKNYLMLKFNLENGRHSLAFEPKGEWVERVKGIRIE